MKLKEWCSKYSISPTHPTTECGAVSVIFTPGVRPGSNGSDSGQSWELCHLTDFAVSTVSGPVVWLVPRSNRERQVRMNLRNFFLPATREELVAAVDGYPDEFSKNCIRELIAELDAESGFCEFCGSGPTCIVCRRGLESEAA